jgi:tetratricopeptide (TPR) repeat protein
MFMSGIDTPQFVPDEPNAGSGRSSRGGRGGRRSPEPWFGRLGQLDFDIDFFERLLVRRGDAVEVLKILAELVSKKGNLKRAVELDSRLVMLQPDDFLARYNLACSLARVGRSEDAIDSLSRAILLGYDDLDHMESDPDLESLHEHPDFQALLGD